MIKATASFEKVDSIYLDLYIKCSSNKNENSRAFNGGNSKVFEKMLPDLKRLPRILVQGSPSLYFINPLLLDT